MKRQTILVIVLVFLLCSVTIAQQIAPNPNPSGNTISLHGGADNSELFDNFGTIYIGIERFCNEGIIYNWGTIGGHGIFTNFFNSFIGNYGTIRNSVDGTFNNGGTIDNDGTIINNDAYFLNKNTGTIHNLSMGTIGNYGDGIFKNYGTIDNWGTIDTGGTFFYNYHYIDNNGTINTYGNIGSMINLSTIDNFGTIDIQGGRFTNMGTINNDGTINLAYDIYEPPSFGNGGILKGTGTFIGDLRNNAGTVAPGNSSGTMTIDGDFILDGSGILDIEIGGFTTGSFDLLDITRTAYLPGGNINFSFLPGYDVVTDVGPYQTKELTFLMAGNIDSFFNPSINYNFSNLQYFQFNVFQRDNELVFEATNLVPVPGAALLGMLGLSLAGWKLRKRQEL